MIRIEPSAIDKSLPVPVGTQLYGLMTYALCFDNLPGDERLPSVRALAERLGLSPVTVAQVYQQLRDAGLIEIRPGLGAFTPAGPRAGGTGGAGLAGLRADIVRLAARARDLGVRPADLVSMLSAQIRGHETGAGLALVFVGIFEAAARDYVAQLRGVLGPRDSVRLVLLEQLRADPALRESCRVADLVVTFLSRKAEVAALLPGAELMPLPFVPSRATREALARLDPRSRVAAVSYFQDYIAVMRPSVQTFAPHIADIRVSWFGAPDLAGVLEGCDAVVFASGAEGVADLLRPGVACFEFRHAPDPAAIDDLLVPRLSELRRARGAEFSPGGDARTCPPGTAVPTPVAGNERPARA